MSSGKVVELVNEWYQFEQNNPEGTLADFCRMYLAKSEHKLPYVIIHPFFGEIPIYALLGRGIGRINKFAYLFSKKALSPLGLNNVDDFVFLDMIRHMENPKKSEVIAHSLLEFSSGIEILKRLHKLELITESVDHSDKRSKRVRITEKGLGILAQCKPRMREVGSFLFDNMSDDERQIMISIITRLDEHLSAQHLLHKQIAITTTPEKF